MARLRLTDFYDFARYLNPRGSPLALEVVEVAWKTHLPAGWTEESHEGKLYFFNHLTEQAVWVHPLDQTFRDVMTEVRAWEEDMCDFAAACNLAASHIDIAARAAFEDLNNWRGPFVSENPEEDNETQVYYYNALTKGSSWECPLTFWDQDLRFRAEALERCISMFAGEPKPFTESVSSILEQFAPLRPRDLDLRLERTQPSVPASAEPPEFLSVRSRDTARMSAGRLNKLTEHSSEYLSARSVCGHEESIGNIHVFTAET
eukprot:GEMP01031387.1.p1 GENE.GEMP01031387.1~~GEMP01031387.1.p1  ORF type:complete len:261 (+),score=49.37 GEMP01031387.1:122-904(+)